MKRIDIGGGGKWPVRMTTQEEPATLTVGGPFIGGYRRGDVMFQLDIDMGESPGRPNVKKTDRYQFVLDPDAALELAAALRRAAHLERRETEEAEVPDP